MQTRRSDDFSREEPSNDRERIEQMKAARAHQIPPPPVHRHTGAGNMPTGGSRFGGRRPGARRRSRFGSVSPRRSRTRTRSRSKSWTRSRSRSRSRSRGRRGGDRGFGPPHVRGPAAVGPPPSGGRPPLGSYAQSGGSRGAPGGGPPIFQAATGGPHHYGGQFVPQFGMAPMNLPSLAQMPPQPSGGMQPPAGGDPNLSGVMLLPGTGGLMHGPPPVGGSPSRRGSGGGRLHSPERGGNAADGGFVHAHRGGHGMGGAPVFGPGAVAHGFGGGPMGGGGASFGPIGGGKVTATAGEKVPLSFKEFVERRIKDDVSPNEAQKIYKAYLDTFGQSEEDQFFAVHCEEEWFVERYDPLAMEKFQKLKSMEAPKKAVAFWNKLIDLKFEALNQNVPDEEKSRFETELLPKIWEVQGKIDESVLISVPHLADAMKKSCSVSVADATDESAAKVKGADSSADEKSGDSVVTTTTTTTTTTTLGGSTETTLKSAADGSTEEQQSEDVSMKVGADGSEQTSHTSLGAVSEERTLESEIRSSHHYYGDRSGADETVFYDNSVFLNGIPLNLKRKTLMKVFEDFVAEFGGSVVSVTLSDPIRNSKKVRYGWIEFDSQATCARVVQSHGVGGLDGARITETFFLHALPKQRSRRKPKYCPTESMKETRVQKDIGRCSQLIAYLDSRARINTGINPLFRMLPSAAAMPGTKDTEESGGEVEEKAESTSEKESGKEGVGKSKSEGVMIDARKLPESSKTVLSLFACDIQKLNVLQLYLRNVHLLCYYCGHEYMNYEHLLARCANTHTRKVRDWISCDGGTFDQMESPWEKDLDAKIDALLALYPSLPDLLSSVDGTDTDKDKDKDKSVWESMTEDLVLSKQTKKISDGKNRCRMCKKLFKGEEFVHKHLRNRHGASITEEVAKLRRKTTLEHYTNDPDKIDAQSFERDEDLGFGHREHGGRRNVGRGRRHHWRGGGRSHDDNYHRERNRRFHRGFEDRSRSPGFRNRRNFHHRRFGGGFRGGHGHGGATRERSPQRDQFGRQQRATATVEDSATRTVRSYSEVQFATDATEDCLDYGFGDTGADTTFGL